MASDRKRKRLGILVNELEYESTFQINIWQGCLPLCLRRNFDLVFLVTRWLSNDDPQLQVHNALARLPKAPALDGLLYSTLVMAFVKDAGLIAGDLPDLPSITMSLGIPGLPRVMVDNLTGLESTIRHLIRVHGKCRIACLPGLLSNPESRIRFECWQRILREEGLEPEDRLWVEGALDTSQGLAWLDTLIDQTGGDFDAVVCVNDHIAMGVSQELQRKGFRVPQDVAVTGFDDVPRAKYLDPPLTTTYQSNEFHTAVTLWLLMDLVEGKAIPPLVTIPSRPIIRGSCGCPPDDWTAIRPPEDDPFYQAVAQPLGVPVDKEFLKTLGRRTLEEDILSTRFPKPEEALGLLQTLMDQEQLRFTRQTSLSLSLNALLRELSTLLSLEGIEALLNTYLDEMDLGPYFLAACIDEAGRPAPVLPGKVDPGHLPLPPKRFKLLAARPAYTGSDRIFLAGDLGPDGWQDQLAGVNLALYPLIVGEHWCGLLALELKADHGLVYSTLAQQLAMVLHREYRLEDSLRRALEEELKTRTEQEKMAALTTLVSGVAHEVNTPLGVGITAITNLQLALDDLQQRFEGGALSQGDMRRYLGDTREMMGILERNLNRAGDLVHSFKQVAARGPAELVYPIKLLPFLRDILRTLSPQLKKSGIIPELAGPEDLVVVSSGSSFIDIITNLVMNALIHGFGNQADPAAWIKLELSLLGEQVCLTVRDNGQGIPPEVLPHIFEPFYTTGRSKGSTGLGLHIVYNVVTHRLGGKITCRSTPGEGTTFTLVFDRVSPETQPGS